MIQSEWNKNCGYSYFQEQEQQQQQQLQQQQQQQQLKGPCQLNKQRATESLHNPQLPSKGHRLGQSGIIRVTGLGEIPAIILACSKN